MLVLVYQGLPFRHHEIHPKIMFFQDTFLHILFSTIDLGTSSKSSGRQNSPTPAGVRRSQTKECRVSQNGQNLSLVTQPGLWHSPKSPPFPRSLDFLSPKIWFGLFGGLRFASPEKHQKTQVCPNPSKSQKIIPWTPKVSISMPFWCRLDLHIR